MVLPASEIIDVARHVPLEVDIARAGPGGAATTTADDDRWSCRPGRDGDGHLDCRLASVPVIGGDGEHEHGGGVGGRVEDRAVRDGDLTVGVDLEEGRISTREAVRDRVALVGVCRLDTFADGCVGLGVLRHGSRGRRLGEHGRVVHPVDRDRDQGGGGGCPYLLRQGHRAPEAG